MSSPSDFSFYLLSLGCSKNLVDSENLNGQMQSLGFKLVESSEEANFIIINTCGFIQTAKEESLEIIFEALENRPTKQIVVIGCLVQRYFQELKKEIPEIDLLYPLFDHNFVTTFCNHFKIDPSKNPIKKQLTFDNQKKSRYLKIGEGCSNNCSYCAIPQIRGPKQSYPSEKILTTAKNILKQGAVELNIIAQDISTYSFGQDDLSSLVKKISELPKVEWIRLLYAHPDHLNDKIINLIKSNAKVVKYLDLPFQHVSQTILKKMGRQGSFQKYHDLIQKIRTKVPEIRLRSTFMLGFPGETEENFTELINFIEKTKIDKVGAFIFSPEDKTKAFNFKLQIPEKIKKKRLQIFMKKQLEISSQKLKKMIGTEVRVIVEEKIDPKTYLGRTEFDAPEVDGLFYLTSDQKITTPIVKAKVTDTIEYDLIGELV